MFVRVGGDYLNLDNFTAISFATEADGTTAVRFETVAGAVRMYSGPEAERIRQLLAELFDGPAPAPGTPLGVGKASQGTR